VFAVGSILEAWVLTEGAFRSNALRDGQVAERIRWRRTFDPVGDDEAALIGMCPSALPYSSPGTPCGTIARANQEGVRAECVSSDGDSVNQAT
jgi:hypothetical protein